MNYELLVIFVLSYIMIEVLEYEDSWIHSLIIASLDIFLFIDLDNILTITGTSLEYAYIMIALIAVMAFYNMHVIYERKKYKKLTFDEWE